MIVIRNKNVGVAYPFRFAASGRVQSVGGTAENTPTVTQLDEAVRDGVHQVVDTEKGERPMLCQFGLGASRFLFHPLGSRLNGFLKREAEEQFSWFVGRARLQELRAHIDTPGAAVVLFARLVHTGFGDESVMKFRIGARV